MAGCPLNLTVVKVNKRQKQRLVMKHENLVTSSASQMTDPELTCCGPATRTPLLLQLQDVGAAGATRESDGKSFSSCNVFLALLLTRLWCQLQRKTASERANRQSSKKPIIGTLAYLHAKIRNSMCLESFSRGWEWGARKGGEVYAGCSTRHMEFAEDCARIKPLIAAGTYLVVSSVQALANSL